MNQFGNVPAFPNATFMDVVRPNADTLYSNVWFDVSKEPILISVAASCRLIPISLRGEVRAFNPGAKLRR